MNNITIILVEPENPGNAGAICRVMKNFDFEKLLLLGPKFSLKNVELQSRAKWANDLISKIKVVQKYDLEVLKKLKFDYIIGTTARVGRDYNILRTPLLPEQLAEKVLNKNKKIGLLFGRESIGLTNEEIKLCDFIVTIPTSKKYGTMNISHAVAIILYEIFKKSKKETIVSHITPMTFNEKKQIMKMINAVIDKKHFTTEQRRETQRILWKKIIGRAMLSKREAYALMGFLKKL